MSLFNFIMLSYTPLNLALITCIIMILFCIIFSSVLKSKNARKVYLVDYSCFMPKKSQQVSREKSLVLTKILGQNIITDETLKLVDKIQNASGIGDSSCLPESFLSTPPDMSMEQARSEAEAAIFATVEALLAKTAIKAEDVGVLVVNCSLFNLAPSLTSMIVNKFKFKDNVKSFNLSGMGCSASLAAIGLVHHLLRTQENTYAMIVSTEIITPYMYKGNDPRKQVINCLFRVGGAAILLSNKPSDQNSSKYELTHTIRTNTGSSDVSYKCIHLEEDEIGLCGVTITKDLVVVAGEGIKAHLTTVGRIVLPMSEKLLFLLDYLRKRVGFGNSNQKPYTPNFRRVIDHFISHVGGTPVINELERILKLDAEPTRMTLYRFGNTSSSAVWYGLAYAEAKGRVKKGNRVWQLGFGSGFECNTVIWHALKNVSTEEADNPWMQDIDSYPIKQDCKPSPIAFEKTH